VQRWLVHLLTRYSDGYASNQYRALQQFFRWLAEEEQIPDPMARLRAPKVTEKLVPVFTSGELSALERTCKGRRLWHVPIPRKPTMRYHSLSTAV
jgi:integrase/recombinase XerD